MTEKVEDWVRIVANLMKSQKIRSSAGILEYGKDKLITYSVAINKRVKV